jgi:hypothetical protein
VLPTLKSKPGRFWGLIGRDKAKMGRLESVQLTEAKAYQLRRYLRRHRRANTKPEKRWQLRRQSLVGEDFTLSHICDVEFWVARLLKTEEQFPTDSVEDTAPT